MEKLCECGCGNAVNLKWSSKTRFLRGHSSKGRVFDDALREKMRQNGAKRKNRSHSEETKKKIGDANRGKKLPPQSKETIEKRRQSNIGKKRSEDFCRKNGEIHRGKTVSPETRKKLSAAAKNRPPASDSYREKMSKITKQFWIDGVYDNSNNLNYSSYEVKLEPILKKQGYMATYLRPFFIKNGDKVRKPDFVNVNSKKVIEFFGTYWHRDRILPDGKRHETPEEYIAWYKEAGWDCVVVWENDFEEFYKEMSN